MTEFPLWLRTYAAILIPSLIGWALGVAISLAIWGK